MPPSFTSNANTIFHDLRTDEKTVFFSFKNDFRRAQNLNLRQENKRLARKTLAYSKEDEWLQHHLTLQMTAHNFTRPPFTKKENKRKIKENVWKKYDKITPMISIGLTDHIWTLKELLTFLTTKISVYKRINTENCRI